MKKRYIIEESEKNEILSMHKALMKEQPTEPVTPVSNTGEEILRKAITAGCLINGKILTNPNKTKFVYRATSKSGKEIDFYGDMTYKFRDGSKTGNWKCDKISQQETQQSTVDTDIARELEQFGWKKRAEIAVTDTELSQLYQKHPKYDLYKLKVNTAKTGGYTPEQTSFIQNWEAKGYKSKLTSDELATGTFKKVNVEGSEQYFPGGLIMYKPASGAQDKKACRDKVKQYYEYWKTKREDISQSEFDQLKSQVQACANQFEGKWGGIFSSVDDDIKTLRGGTGGPLSYGEDAKWRLK